MSGTTVCRLHGGKAPQVRRAAERRMALAEARDLLGVAREVDPSDALVESVHEAAGNVSTLRERAQDLESGDDPNPAKRNALRETCDEERDRLARMAKLAHDAGIEGRRVELAGLDRPGLPVGPTRSPAD